MGVPGNGHQEVFSPVSARGSCENTPHGLARRIVEFRGPLGPGGVLVYRIRILPFKPRAHYIEVLEEQLIPIPTPPKVGPSPLVTAPRTEPKAPKVKAKKRRKGE
jgi:hypothetical protein